ncbi:MAG: acyl-CoA dehydrogenase family protein [Gemmatimonadaceae bacterium]
MTVSFVSTVPEGERFRASVRRFIKREVTPRAERWERSGTFPRAAVAACAKRGYFTLDGWRTAILAEELARSESMGTALSIFVQAGLIVPLLDRLAVGRQRSEFLEPTSAGLRVGAMAVSEPGAGSDFAGLTCRAVANTRGDFVIDGVKTYITCGAAADFVILAARQGVTEGEGEGEAADRELSLFAVPTRLRGVRVERLTTLGLRVTAMGRLTFKKCRVPAANRLGDPGAGYGAIQEALNRERLFGGVGAVAWAQYALEKTATYLRARRAFGRSLNRFQSVRHEMADRATELEAARQLNYATLGAWIAGKNVTKEIAMIKLFAYQAVQRTIETCLQLHGGLGYVEDHWTSRWYRDARALTIAAGTPQVMRDLIAAHLRL